MSIITDGSVSVAAAAEILGVSAATVRNWLRLGRLSSLDSAGLERLKAEIAKGGLLRSRRNKTALRSRQQYGGYISCSHELSHLFSGSFSENEIRVILSEAALRLFSPGENRLPAFLAGEISIGPDDLILDLLGRARPAKNTAALLADKWTPDKNQDVLGFIYMSLLPLDLRRGRGAYYTPPELVKKTCAAVTDGEKILDPCCGSGNFLICLAEKFGPEKLYAADTDQIAVALARINMYLRYPGAIEHIRKNIAVKSFFELSGSYDAIVGNPPWGGFPESSARFVCQTPGLLNEGGVMAFVLPQALLSARKHIEMREKLLAEMRLISADYVGDCFHGVNCPSVILAAKKSSPFGTAGCRVNSAFTINTNRSGDLCCLSLNVTDDDYARLRQMRSLKNAAYLKGNARFALGIVTGHNSSALLSEKMSGAEPVLRGSDISPFSISEPCSYLIFRPENFQQCAPEEVYRAEKIVYRFIGKRPVFAVDRLGRLTLNSCNVIIPHIDGLSIDYITAVLNSRAVGFFLEKSFDTAKWLRWHLEEVPMPVVPPELQEEICRSEDRDDLIDAIYGLDNAF